MNPKWRDQWMTGSVMCFTRLAGKKYPATSLRPAFTSLGLDRVAAGARALYMDNRGWNDCFLALAYGEAGDLTRRVDESVPDDDELAATWSFTESMSRLLGLTVEEVDVVIQYFDTDRAGLLSELVQWLDSHNVNAATVLAQAQCEVESRRLSKEMFFQMLLSAPVVDPAR
jgi:hypothetical protein